MKRLTRDIIFALLALGLSGSPATAQAPVDLGEFNPVQARIDDVLALFRGSADPTTMFNASFLNAVPSAQLQGFVQQTVAQHGAPLNLTIREQLSATSAVLDLTFADSIGTVLLDVEPQRPHLIAGLRLTGFEAPQKSIAEVAAAIDALPGQQGLAVVRLDHDQPPMAVIDPDGRFAIGSTFKLYILAELDRTVRAGERRWSDVVPLGPPSIASGMDKPWPNASPMTLHTLATLMISVSDNRATDTLIRLIGQGKLSEIVQKTGHSHPDDLHPMLTTREAMALKMPQGDTIRKRYVAAAPDERPDIILNARSELAQIPLDPRIMMGQPSHIDSVEWFASAADIIALMDWLDRRAAPETLAIMALNPGIGQDAARRWDYLGYKGGSEPGVLSMNFLMKAKSGARYAVSAHWNDSTAPLDEGRFIALVTRLVNLLAERD